MLYIIGGILLISFLISLPYIQTGTKPRSLDTTEATGEEKSLDHPYRSIRRQQSALIRLKKELDERAKDIEHKVREIGLAMRELSLERKEIYNQRQELAMKEQKALYEAKKRLDTLRNLQLTFNLEQREKHLQLFNEKVRHFAKTERDIHALKLKDIDQKEQEMKLKFRDERQQIKEIYNGNKNTLKELELVSRSNQLDRRDLSQERTGAEHDFLKRELDGRMSIIQTIEEGWHMSNDITSIQAYNQQGYQYFSPMIEEVEHLRGEVNRLRRQIDSPAG